MFAALLGEQRRVIVQMFSPALSLGKVTCIYSQLLEGPLMSPHTIFNLLSDTLDYYIKQ